MVNDINGFRNRSVDSPDGKPVGRSNSTAGRPGSPAAAAGTTDTVQLTEAAGRLRELDALLAQTPEVDSARVDDLRRAIAEGRYTVDSVHVADKLIALEQSLFGAHKD
jgi:negative regulator of flagellin synthesis FlgM